MKSKLPAPAKAAATKPKVVGTVLDAKRTADRPTPMIKQIRNVELLALEVLV